MKHIKTLNRANLSATAKKGGCGKCQASCQSACKTSCTVGNRSVQMRKINNFLQIKNDKWLLQIL